MQGDGVTCKSNDPAVPYLIFSNRNQLRRINLETRDYNVLVYNLKNTIALDFCYNTSQVFWTDIVDDKIYCGWMDTNSHNAGEDIDFSKYFYLFLLKYVVCSCVLFIPFFCKSL